MAYKPHAAVPTRQSVEGKAHWKRSKSASIASKQLMLFLITFLLRTRTCHRASRVDHYRKESVAPSFSSVLVLESFWSCSLTDYRTPTWFWSEQHSAHQTTFVSHKSSWMCPLKKESLLTPGFTRPSAIPWSSLCLLETKPGGSLKFITDYQKVNSITNSWLVPSPIGGGLCWWSGQTSLQH